MTVTTGPASVDVWGAVLAAVRQAVDDVRENRAPPAAVPNPHGLADALERLNANLPAVITTLRTHQGEITGAADILAALAKAGVPHAADIEAALLAAPGALAAAEKWLPVILPFVTGGIFAPAPRGGPPIAEADWSRGFPQPQPVDNPSGAIGGPLPHSS